MVRRLFVIHGCYVGSWKLESWLFFRILEVFVVSSPSDDLPNRRISDGIRHCPDKRARRQTVEEGQFKTREVQEQDKSYCISERRKRKATEGTGCLEEKTER